MSENTDHNSALEVTSYQDGDEHKILPQFNRVFYTNRSLEAWQWKFKQNPLGGPYTSIIWCDGELAAHYAAYPVTIYLDGKTETTYQVGDTFTVPEFRKKGFGPRSLLAKVVNHFHQHYCEGKIRFFYGFNRGTIQKLGKMFLRYQALAPVYEWCLEKQVIQKHYQRSICWRALLGGYRVQVTQQAGAWADTVFSGATAHFQSMLEKKQGYLQWRYQQNPERQYDFFILRQWGRAVAWGVCSIEGKQIILGDALFVRKSPVLLQVLLYYMVRYYQKSQEVDTLCGWFSDYPQWLQQNLQQAGMHKHRQADQLDLCLTTFADDFDATDFAGKFYFTRGDSDLF